MRIPFSHHIGTKVMAVVLAVFLWAFGYMENIKSVDIPCRVQFTLPAGYGINAEMKSIELSVKGPRRLVDNFKTRNPVLVVNKMLLLADLAGVTDSAPLPVTVVREDIDEDKKLNFEGLPFTITDITVSRQESKSLPVKIMPKNQPAPGYVFDDVKSIPRPSTVTVTGSKSALDRLDAVYIRPDIGGMSTPSSWDESVDLPDTLKANIDMVKVWLYFNKQPIVRDFSNVPVKALAPPGFAYTVKLNPETVTVTVEGPDVALATLKAADITAYAVVRPEFKPQALPEIVKIEVAPPANCTARVAGNSDTVMTIQDAHGAANASGTP